MRPVILIVGIIIIAAGFVVLDVPLVQHSSKTVSSTTPVSLHISSGVPIWPTEPVAASWSSNQSVTVVARSCSSINASASTIWGQCTGGSNLSGTGSSGSLTVNVPVGGYIWVVLLAPSGSTTNETATLTMSTSLPSGALGLWGLGASIAVFGLLLRRRKKSVAAPPTMMASPTSPQAPGEAKPSEPPTPPPRSPPPETEEQPLD